MAAKFFTGRPLDGPDPECAAGHGAEALRAADRAAAPRPAPDHSQRGGAGGRFGGRGPVPVTIGRRPCNEDPLADLAGAARRP